MLKGSSPNKESGEVTGGLIGSQSPARYDKLTSPSQREREMEGPAPGAKRWKAKVVGALALLAVVVVVVTVVVVVPRHRGSGSKAAPLVQGGVAQPPSPSPAAALDNIVAACNLSMYRDSCISSLSASPGASAASIQDLVTIGFEIADRDVAPVWQAAIAFLRGKQVGGSELFVDALNDCTDNMESCLDSFNKSISTFRNMSTDKDIFDSQASDIQTYMSDTLTEIETCSESLGETDQSACDHFKQLVEKVKEELSNSLTVFNYWVDSLDSTTGPHRRLLSLSRSGRFSITGSLSSTEAAEIQPVVQTDEKVVDRAGPGSGKTVRCVLNCFRADPVCGEDGLTYWCGTADAKCAGVGVAHAGFCNMENGGAGGKGYKAGQSLLLLHLVWLILAGLMLLIELP